MTVRMRSIGLSIAGALTATLMLSSTATAHPVSVISAPEASFEKLPAKAADTYMQLTKEDYEYIDSFFVRTEVPQSERDVLIRKIESGQPLDSEIGAEPDWVQLRTISGKSYELKKYPDGSRTLSTAGMGNLVGMGKNGEASPLASVTQCRKVTGSTNRYYGCFVEHQAATWSISFRVDYWGSSSATGITRVAEARSGGVGVGSAKAAILDNWSSGDDYAKAEARARQNITVKGIPTSRDIGVTLKTYRFGGRSVSHWGS